MKQPLPDELMQNWSPEQLLAVYDFCKLMSEAIWQQHEDVLLEQMIDSDREREADLLERQTDNGNLELPFDDNTPF